MPCEVIIEFQSCFAWRYTVLSGIGDQANTTDELYRHLSWCHRSVLFLFFGGGGVWVFWSNACTGATQMFAHAEQNPTSKGPSYSKHVTTERKYSTLIKILLILKLLFYLFCTNNAPLCIIQLHFVCFLLRSHVHLPSSFTNICERLFLIIIIIPTPPYFSNV